MSKWSAPSRENWSIRSHHRPDTTEGRRNCGGAYCRALAAKAASVAACLEEQKGCPSRIDAIQKPTSNAASLIYLEVEMSLARLLQFAIGCAAMAVVGTPAVAEQASYGAHYEERNQATCNGSCWVYFSPIPANKVFIARRILCRMSSASPIIGHGFAVLQGVETGYMRSSPLSYPTQGVNIGGSTLYYSSANETRFAVGASRYMRVDFTTVNTAFSVIDCHVSGTLYPYPGAGPTPEELN